VHNLLDFSSEVPGVMVGLSVCTAIVVGGSSGTRTERRLNVWRHPRRVAIVGAAALFLGIVLVVPTIGKDLDSDRSLLHDLALDPATGREPFREAVRKVMLRHPAEPYFPYAGELRASRTRDESVIPWAERTLDRAPVYGPAHFLLGRFFTHVSRSQARLEYRLAMHQMPELVPTSTEEYVGLIQSYDDAIELTPDGESGLRVLESIVRSRALVLPATTWLLDDELLRRFPLHPEVVTRRARATLADLQAEEAAPWCAADPPACRLVALAASEVVIRVSPASCEGHRIHALSLAAANEPDRAYDELSAAIDVVNERTTCLVALLDVALETKVERKVSTALERLVRAGCSATSECIGNILYAGQFEDRRGNLDRAHALYRNGRDRYPESDELLAATGNAGSRLGLHAEALDSFARLASRHPEDPQWPAAVAREKAQLIAAPHL
jgi:tetratricopeptide (TPR) repeat protein